MGCSRRDPRVHVGLRPLRLLPADVPDLRALERGDGLAARADPPHGRTPRRDDRAERDGGAALRPLSRAAWRACRRAPRACATTGSSSRTRAAVEEELERSLSDRVVRGLLFRLLPHPGRMRAALRLAPLGRATPMPKRFRPLVDIAPRWRGRGHVPALTPASGPPRARVGLLTGCVQSAVFPDVNAATARVLAADGFEVVAPRRAAAAHSRFMLGDSTKGRASRGGSSTRSTTSISSSSTRRAAARI